MRRVLKWIGIGLVGVLSILIVIAGTLAITGNGKLNKPYDIQPEPVKVTRQKADVERGEYLASISCIGCHGDDLSGDSLFSDPALGSIYASNLTTGSGGISGTYSDADLVRAIRHGVDNEGKALAIMPSRAYWHYSDEDLGAIVSYIRSVPSVDSDPGEREIKFLGKVLIGAGVLNFFAAEAIDHDAPRTTAATGGSSYGEYLVNTNDCRQCHGMDLSGGQPGEPGAPAGPDLAIVSSWSRDEFVTAIRTGATPDGRQLDPAYMPWKEFGRMSNGDLAALYEYLSSPSTTVSTKE